MKVDPGTPTQAIEQYSAGMLELEASTKRPSVSQWSIW